MASDLTPGENQPNYQRWEPKDLKHLAHPQVKLPTAEDIERIHQEAHRDGYEVGHREGFEAGLTKADSEVARIQALGQALDEAMRNLEQELGQDVLALALDIAKQVLTRALDVKPELLLPVIRAAIESLPHSAQHPHIHIHPQDAALVRDMIDAEPHAGWRVVEDARIVPGGCRIETSIAEVDATLPSRWHRISSALGQDNAWLTDGTES